MQSNVSGAAIIKNHVSVDSKTVSVSIVLNLVIFRRKSKISCTNQTDNSKKKFTVKIDEGIKTLNSW